MTGRRSQQLREKFEQIENTFENTKIRVPKKLRDQVCAILTKHTDLRWDDAVRIALMQPS